MKKWEYYLYLKNEYLPEQIKSFLELLENYEKRDDFFEKATKKYIERIAKYKREIKELEQELKQKEELL